MNYNYDTTSLPGEEWRAIAGYEGYYEASSSGRIKSLARTIDASDGSQRRYRTKIMTPKSRGAYLFTILSKGLKYEKISVAREVAKAFHGQPKPGDEVNHKDGNKHNNSAQNLEWMTKSENATHMHRVLFKDVREQKYNHKLTDAKVLLGRKLFAAGQATYSSLGRMFGTSHVAIRNAIVGKTWKTLNG